MFGWVFVVCWDSEEVMLPPVFGLPALLRLTAVHFYISAVKWSFVDWNTLLKTEPQTDGSKKKAATRASLTFNAGESLRLYEH